MLKQSMKKSEMKKALVNYRKKLAGRLFLTTTRQFSSITKNKLNRSFLRSKEQERLKKKIIAFEKKLAVHYFSTFFSQPEMRAKFLTGYTKAMLRQNLKIQQKEI